MVHYICIGGNTTAGNLWGQTWGYVLQVVVMHTKGIIHCRQHYPLTSLILKVDYCQSCSDILVALHAIKTTLGFYRVKSGWKRQADNVKLYNPVWRTSFVCIVMRTVWLMTYKEKAIHLSLEHWQKLPVVYSPKGCRFSSLQSSGPRSLGL